MEEQNLHLFSVSDSIMDENFSLRVKSTRLLLSKMFQN